MHTTHYLSIMKSILCLFGILSLTGTTVSFTVPSHRLTSSSSSSSVHMMNVILNDDNGDELTQTQIQTQTQQHRRDFFKSLSSMALVGTVATSTTIPTTSMASANDNVDASSSFSFFKDESAGFQIKVPQGWEKSEQTLPDRRRMVLFMNENGDDASASPNAEKDLMFVAFTPVRDDFTSLGSMGSLEQVGQMTILPKGQLMGVESDNRMLFSESKKNAYYFDYVSRSPGQPKRHFRTIFSLAQGATGGAGAVLVTITAQTTDDRYDGLKSTFDEIIDSYGKIK